MLTVHHLGLSQSERVVWLCEELELDYELVRHLRDPVTRLAPASLTHLHTSGLAPVIVEDGVVLAESGAIVDYLRMRHGNGALAPSPSEPDFPSYLYWFHFANGSMLPRALLRSIIGRLGGCGEDAVCGAMAARLDAAYDLIEARLTKADYFAGSGFTAADIMMVFPLTTLRHFIAKDLAPYPHLRSYLRRIGDRSAYRSAMEKADPGVEPLLS